METMTYPPEVNALMAKVEEKRIHNLFVLSINL